MTKKKEILLYFVMFLLGLLTTMIIGISDVFADELEPTNVIQYYEYYANNEFKEVSFNSEDTINLADPTTVNYPYAISLILYGNFKKDYTYTISTNIETQFNTEYFKFYYENLDYLIMYGELTVNNEKITCNLNPISQNHAYSMFCSFKAEEDINQINLSLINKDWQNNGYVPFGSDDYVKFTNYNIEEYDNSSEIITNQNQTIIDQNNQTNDKLDGIQDSITESNKETQEVIKDQFNDCRDSYNLITSTSFTTGSLYSYYELQADTPYILSIKLKDGGTRQSYYIGFKEDITNASGNYKWLLSNGSYGTSITGSDGFYYINNLISGTYVNYVVIYPKDDTTISSLFENYDIQLVKSSTYIEYEEPGEICSNKMDETNDKLGDLNDSLNDSNVDGSLDSAGSFFDSFTTTDHGGLSGIITAPLVAINEMLNTSCSPMTATFKGKELSLPCGYEFWNRLGAIQDFINIVLGGMLCYRIIIKLYKLIERIKNPEDDRLEVMDL